MVERRKDDSGYEARRIFDGKTVVLLMAAVFGSGGAVGFLNYFTDPNIQMENEIRDHNIQIETLKAEQRKSQMRLENYIASHSEEEKLRERLTEKELEHIKELLQDIKEDVGKIRNGK